MHYRSAVLVVIVVSLTLGAPLQAQTTFVSPGAAAVRRPARVEEVAEFEARYYEQAAVAWIAGRFILAESPR